MGRSDNYLKSLEANYYISGNCLETQPSWRETMKKNTLLITVVLSLSIFNLTLTFLPENVVATTHFVGGGGPGNFTTIQDAVNASSPGDTIYVYSGTYFENVIVNEILSLIGEDRNTTVIDGRGTGDVVSIVVDWVNVTGFTITKSGVNSNDAGIEVSSSSNSQISNITALNSSKGILLFSSNNNIIVDSYAYNNTEGIYLELSDHNNISFSDAINNRNGIHLDNSNNNTVMYNNLSDRVGCIFIEFSQFNLVSNNTMLNCRSGIDLWYSDNNTFADNDVSWNEAIYIEYSNKNAFLNNTISFNSEGISIGYSNDLTFRGNAMVGNGFQLWGSKTPEHWNSHIIDVTNTVNGRSVYYWKNITGGAIPPGAGQVLLYGCTNVTVDNQNLSDATVGLHSFISLGLEISNNSIFSNDIGIWLESATHANITGNNLASNRWDMLVEGSSHIIISDNTGPNDRGIWLDDSHNNTIFNNSKATRLMFSHDNLLTGNNISSGRGFEIVGSNDNTISLNTVSGVWGWHSLSMLGSSSNAIIDNTIFNSSGIELDRSSNNIIHNNQLTNNGFGLAMEQSTENLIENNTISLSNTTGIRLRVLSDNNTLTNNTVSWSGLYGIQVRDSFDNTIYHNEFINNTEQAFNHVNCTNQWDNGYPLGGNYWSDYNGVDTFSGSSQDQPGSDGIGDTPYDILGGNDRDRYPLMSPSGPVFPRPPLTLTAKLSGNNHENVTLVWQGSPDDGAGFKTVVRYDIFRNSTYESTGQGYGFLATVPNGTYQYVDNSVGEGDPNNYFYRVCAVDFNDNSTCGKLQAGKFTRPLSKGLNLVSVPLGQMNDTREVVLQTVSYGKAWTYDSIDFEWKSFLKSKPYTGNLEHIFHTMGVWMNVTSDSNFTIAGVVLNPVTIDLKAGWNLVGFPSFNMTYTVGDLKASLPVIRVEGLDPTAPPYFLKPLLDSDFIQAGRGYWIQVSQDSTWTITNN